jgi:hypothetical protein
VLIPELAPQLLARGSEAGYNRLVMGVHYPLDVIGGRMTGQAAAGDRWNDPSMRDVLKQAGQEIRKELEWRTGKPLSEAIAEDSSYRSTEDAVEEYTERMTYDFDQVGDPDARLTVPPGGRRSCSPPPTLSCPGASGRRCWQPRRCRPGTRWTIRLPQDTRPATGSGSTWLQHSPPTSRSATGTGALRVNGRACVRLHGLRDTQLSKMLKLPISGGVRCRIPPGLGSYATKAT